MLQQKERALSKTLTSRRHGRLLPGSFNWLGVIQCRLSKTERGTEGLHLCLSPHTVPPASMPPSHLPSLPLSLIRFNSAPNDLESRLICFGREGKKNSYNTPQPPTSKKKKTTKKTICSMCTAAQKKKKKK